MGKPPRIYVIGSLNVDLVQNVPRLPRPGETLKGDDLRTFAGGKGGNQAFAAARMGGRVSMVGQVGRDNFGRMLIESLQSAGASTDYVGVVDVSTGAAMILVMSDGENAIVLSPGANATLTPNDADDRLRDLASGSVLLCQLEIPLDTVEHALAVARRAGAMTILDPAPASARCLPMLRSVDVVTPNTTEALQLVGRDGNVETDLEALQLARELRQLGAGTVVLTLGSRGCCIVNDEISTVIPGYDVAAVDTTAAGDVFNGAFACALAANQSVVDAARFGNAAAALSVTKPGAQSSVPTREEVDSFVQRRTPLN
jgi:ribokinase